MLILSDFSPVALIWIAKAFLFDWPLRKWSLMKLPSIASSMGLTHIKSDYIKEFGEIRGKIRGRQIQTQPDYSMNPTIRVSHINKHSGLELSLSKPHMVPEKKASDFITTNWKFNLIFRTKRARKNDGEKITSSRELTGLITSFYEKWIYKIDSFIIGDDDIFCSFRYGFNFFPYIPSWKFEELVNDLAEIAEGVDSLLES